MVRDELNAWIRKRSCKIKLESQVGAVVDDVIVEAIPKDESMPELRTRGAKRNIAEELGQS